MTKRARNTKPAVPEVDYTSDSHYIDDDDQRIWGLENATEIDLDALSDDAQETIKLILNSATCPDCEGEGMQLEDEAEQCHTCTGLGKAPEPEAFELSWFANAMAEQVIRLAPSDGELQGYAFMITLNGGRYLGHTEAE